jgi:cob(I)alamin adenosyltransferase
MPPFNPEEPTFPRFNVRPGERPRLHPTFVHVYTGGGKGKSTAAFGLLVRAVGHGLRCCLVQFLKKGNYGEIQILRQLPGVRIEQFGSGHWVRRPPDPEDRRLAQEALACAEAVVSPGDYDLVVLDEINVALVRGLVSWDAVRRLLSHRHPTTELVLTGRGAPRALLEQADVVTMMLGMKHPYHRGVDARAGIEY